MLITLGVGAPLLAFGAAAAITRYHLSGEDLSQYDAANFPVTFDTDERSPGNEAVKEYLREKFIKPAKAPGSSREKLAAKRKMFDEIDLLREFDCEFKPAIAQSGNLIVSGEWTIPDGCDPAHRILYLHGGANTVGSAISHRPIITNIANRTRCAIFAPNYRLMPENPRMAAVEDCRAAYEWICESGPDGEASAQTVAIGGDSAGGNLTLSLINWIRDKSKRRPDAAFAISPAVDSTCTSPSLRNNFPTDFMLQPLAAPILKIPRPMLLWSLWRINKMSPADPVISPIFADLSNLPPTLIQISAAEMLYDDARRYVAKAQSCGSPVKLQSWAHMAHVWHAFDRMLPEAHHAFDEIAAFLKENGAAIR